MMVTDGDSEVETKSLETSPDTAEEEQVVGVFAHSTSAMFSGDALFEFRTSHQLADLEKISAAYLHTLFPWQMCKTLGERERW
jgi:hypothetical protein